MSHRIGKHWFTERVKANIIKIMWHVYAGVKKIELTLRS